MTHNTFIAGPSGKSGTTLLANLLNTHPNYQSFKIKEHYSFGQMFNTCDWVVDQVTYEPNLASTYFINSVRTWYSNYINPDQLPCSATKFTNFKHYRWLRYIFPEDPVIVILRHPIDNFASWKTWEIKYGANPPPPSDWFNHRIPVAMSSLEQIDNKLLLYFEDLINDPQGTMDMVCDFLKFERYAVDFSIAYQTYKRMTSFTAINNTNNGIITDVVQRRNMSGVLTDNEIAAIKSVVVHSGLLDTVLSRYQDDFI